MSEHSTAGLTIRDLRAALDRAVATGSSEDDVVILAKDSEGNDFSPLAQEMTNDAVYLAESSYAGELDYWDEDEVENLGPDRLTYSEWRAEAVADGGLPCLVLWPTN